MRDQPKCRKCGRLLKFIKTKKGKHMPVDSFSVHVMPAERGALYWMENGETVRGYLCDKTAPGAVKAYEPHWYTCPFAKEMKRTPQKKTDEELRERILREREKAAKLAEERRRKEAEREERIQAELAQTSLFLNREEVYR